MKMKDKRKKKAVSDNMYMMLAENAKSINTYGSVGPAGQQILMNRASYIYSKEDERRLVEKLTK